MVKMVDFILDSNGDYLIQNGDFVIGFSDNQNIFDIIYTEKGEYKANPQIGCGMQRVVNGPADKETIKQIISSNLALDGFKVSSVKVDRINEQYEITPNASR